MSIHLPPPTKAFPKLPSSDARSNAWGSQWKHLGRTPRLLVRNTMRDGLRWLRG